MRLAVSDSISLTSFHPDDKPALVECLHDPEIDRWTLRIPHPYTAVDAQAWFGILAEGERQHGEPTKFAVRDGRALVGCIGFDGLIKNHRAEIGYWLAQPYWRRGIMTAAVGRAMQYALDHWKLVRVAAYVFPDNAASARVLEKNGFRFEGLLRKLHQKNGRFLDSRLYAHVR